MRIYQLFPMLNLSNWALLTNKQMTAATLLLNKLIPEWDVLTLDQQFHILNIAAGVEIEVENAIPLHNKPYQWVIERDHSLRGETAYEYKTPLSLRIGHIVHYLASFEQGIMSTREKHKNPEIFQFSERTSVHVHLDVRMFTQEEIAKFIALYIPFEHALFNFAGGARKHNIFCVPIRQATILGSASEIFEYIRIWEKYSALNLHAIPQFGTIEFRHMYGTDNTQQITEWLCLLGLLHYAALHWPLKKVVDLITHLKFESHYTQVGRQIFGPLYDHTLAHGPAYDIDEAVTDAKLFLFSLIKD